MAVSELEGEREDDALSTVDVFSPVQFLLTNRLIAFPVTRNSPDSHQAGTTRIAVRTPMQGTKEGASRQGQGDVIGPRERSEDTTRPVFSDVFPPRDSVCDFSRERRGGSVRTCIQ